MTWRNIRDTRLYLGKNGWEVIWKVVLAVSSEEFLRWWTTLWRVVATRMSRFYKTWHRTGGQEYATNRRAGVPKGLSTLLSAFSAVQGASPFCSRDESPRKRTTNEVPCSMENGSFNSSHSWWKSYKFNHRMRPGLVYGDDIAKLIHEFFRQRSSKGTEWYMTLMAWCFN